MRIVVNDIAASKGGAMTVLRDFYNCVKENDTENEWIFLLGDKYLEETENIKVIALPEIKKSRFKKIWFDCFSGKKLVSKLKPDVVFSMQNIIVFGLKIPQVLYIHQPVPFQSIKKFSFFKKSERALAVYQYLIAPFIRKSAVNASKVIVQTEWMKNAVCSQCRISSEKVKKISPNVKSLVEYISENEHDKTEFFYPTSEVVYKNNSCIFEAANLLDKERIDYHITLTLPEKYTREKVSCVGRLDYSEVISNYNKGTLIFPSYIETFGYPLIEAKTMGTIVLASDCSFSREILDGYENAYFFNPFNSDELATLMKKVVCGEIKRKTTNILPSTDCNEWKKVLDVVVDID